MKKLIITMGLLSTIALPLSMVACSSKVETNNEYDYGFKAGDVVEVYFIGGSVNVSSSYIKDKITKIDNRGVRFGNTFIPWTAIKSISLALDNNGDPLK